ncbi:putative serine/threonine-protein phosphatase 2A regulatory subunit B'' subunit gamma [Plasmopara halstedii]
MSSKATKPTSSIPCFYFPHKQKPLKDSDHLRHNGVMARLDSLILSKSDFSQLVEYICSFAYDPKLSPDIKQEVKQRSKKTGIVEVDRLLDLQMSLMLSYHDYRSISKGSWCKSRSLLAILSAMLSSSQFLMFAQDTSENVNGYTLLEYIHQLQLLLRVARFVHERSAQPGGIQNETLSEKSYIGLITEMIEASSHELGISNDNDFLKYYILICVRMLLLPHGVHHVRAVGLSIHQVVNCSRFVEFYRLMDKTLRERYDIQKNLFLPQRIRNIHRQYLQLDRDSNGMLSMIELKEYGKKRAFNSTGYEPTHDLTDAFVTQVFAEVLVFNDELDYHAYLDFTLIMSDRESAAALRFFWSVLDFQKQGYLDAFTLDYFLRSLLEKIFAHEGREDAPTVDRLRIFDVVAPICPGRITWQDLQRCKLGHGVVRFITDYVGYRKFEDCGGCFPS